MGMIKGDKARFNRERRKKLARRVDTRARRAAIAATGAATPAATTEPAGRPARAAQS